MKQRTAGGAWLTSRGGVHLRCGFRRDIQALLLNCSGHSRVSRLCIPFGRSGGNKDLLAVLLQRFDFFFAGNDGRDRLDIFCYRDIEESLGRVHWLIQSPVLHDRIARPFFFRDRSCSLRRVRRLRGYCQVHAFALGGNRFDDRLTVFVGYLGTRILSDRDQQVSVSGNPLYFLIPLAVFGFYRFSYYFRFFRCLCCCSPVLVCLYSTGHRTTPLAVSC